LHQSREAFSREKHTKLPSKQGVAGSSPVSRSTSLAFRAGGLSILALGRVSSALRVVQTAWHSRHGTDHVPTLYLLLSLLAGVPGEDLRTRKSIKVAILKAESAYSGPLPASFATVIV
jgi:hypothetical protein